MMTMMMAYGMTTGRNGHGEVDDGLHLGHVLGAPGTVPVLEGDREKRTIAGHQDIELHRALSAAYVGDRTLMMRMMLKHEKRMKKKLMKVRRRKKKGTWMWYSMP